jgi:hypothetical protein
VVSIDTYSNQNHNYSLANFRTENIIIQVYWNVQYISGAEQWHDIRWDFSFSRRRIWRRQPSSISLMMKAVSIPEMSVYFYKNTWRNIPEGCHLHLFRGFMSEDGIRLDTKQFFFLFHAAAMLSLNTKQRITLPKFCIFRKSPSSLYASIVGYVALVSISLHKIVRPPCWYCWL